MRLTENTLFHNRYLLKRQLGCGGFSQVWLVDDTEVNNKKRALKVYMPDKGLDDRGAQILKNEFEMVCDLNHAHLLRPAHYDVCNGSPYLVVPYCESGSAAHLIGEISEEEAWRFLHHVASGLAYLHTQEPPIIHQDIKPDNILIDKQGNYLITDFGISSKARNTLRRSVGETKSPMTVAYTPPERFERNLMVLASDIWSLGATMYELLEGDVPFFHLEGGKAQMGGAIIPEFTGSWSPLLKKVVIHCLQKETWNRPTAAQLVEWAVTRQVNPPHPHTNVIVPVKPKPVNIIAPVSPKPVNAMALMMPKPVNVKLHLEEPMMVFVEGNFMIGKYQVTQREWKRVMGYNPSFFKGDLLPVERVSWNDTQIFINKLNTLTGRQYRLPTEEEWEFAARGGNKSRNCIFSGSNIVDLVAWYSENSDCKTHRVGAKLPNELGIYDMSGNVNEWCSSGPDRVFRGGSWLNSAGSVYISARGSTTASDRGSNIGFRVALNMSDF